MQIGLLQACSAPLVHLRRSMEQVQRHTIESNDLNLLRLVDL